MATFGDAAVWLHGLPEHLDEAQAEELGEAVEEVGQVIAEAARVRAPRRTGALQASIASTAAARSSGIPVVTVGSPLVYARWVEYGTRHSRPHPFLGPAVDATAGEVDALFEAALDRALETVAKE